MKLRLDKLQKIVKNVVNEEKRYDLLKEEITRALGPVVVTTHGPRLMAETANDRLDVMLRCNNQIGPTKTSVLVKFINSDEPQVRRLVARLLPESFLRKMMFDSDQSVRWSVAERLPSNMIAEMVKRWPSDDHLRTVYRSKKLFEAGLPSPKLSDEEFDINGEKPLGDTARYDEHPGMTDLVYDSLARDFVKQYGRTLETHWEETAARTYANGMKSQGVEVDTQKLIDAIYELLSKRDEKSLEENVFKSLAATLREADTMEAPYMPVIEERIDKVDALINSRASSSEYIHDFENLFKVSKSSVHNIGKGQGINENFSRVIVPSEATLPTRNLRPTDERALDMYVRNWNRQRQLRNQPYKLSWSPGGRDKVTFQLGLV